MPSANCDSTLGAPLTTTGCRKYSSTAAPRRADRSTPWKDGWYLQKAPTPTVRSPAAERQVGSLSSLPAGPCPAQVFQVLLRIRKKRGRAIPEKAGHAGHSPEVGLSELLHVELFIREGREVDITNGREHVSWEARRVLASWWDILQGLAEPPKGPRTSNPGPSQPLIHSSIHSCIGIIQRYWAPTVPETNEHLTCTIPPNLESQPGRKESLSLCPITRAGIQEGTCQSLRVSK